MQNTISRQPVATKPVDLSLHGVDQGYGLTKGGWPRQKRREHRYGKVRALRRVYGQAEEMMRVGVEPGVAEAALEEDAGVQGGQGNEVFERVRRDAIEKGQRCILTEAVPLALDIVKGALTPSCEANPDAIAGSGATPHPGAYIKGESEWRTGTALKVLMGVKVLEGGGAQVSVSQDNRKVVFEVTYGNRGEIPDKA